MSDNPDTFDLSSPCDYVDIHKGIITYITDDNISRKYFLLSFNDKYFRTIGARFVPMDGDGILEAILTGNIHPDTHQRKGFDFKKIKRRINSQRRRFCLYARYIYPICDRRLCAIW